MVAMLRAKNLIGEEAPYTVDDKTNYVLDLHTKAGKRSDHDYEKFALEGAYVKNENTNFLNPEYREIYILLKKKLDLYNSRGRKLR